MPEELPQGLTEDELTLPNGVSLDEVSFESDVEAFAERTNEYGEEYSSPFNPKNGRWYEESDPGCASYNNTTVAGGLTVNCAYSDCGGRTTIEVQDTVRGSCPECGEGKMGRHQFSDGLRRKRKWQNDIHSRTKTLFDEYSKEMNRLTEAGAGPVAAMDYIMCSVAEIPYEEWAEARGVNKSTVKQNIKRVANALGERVTYKTRGY